MGLRAILIVVFFFSTTNSAAAAVTPSADPSECSIIIASGISITGVVNVTESSAKYCAFYGIPYANPPIGDNRFKKAVPRDLVENISNGRQFVQIPSDCTQDSKNGIYGEEDCLYLNVFTPNVNATLPVVVWIHGGSLNVGSGLSAGFNPSAFIEEDIVVVSFNYRLNMFGFFPDANVGLHDQTVALRWVQTNIHHFGGDRNRVTIMGWSAGSGSVNFLMFNGEAKGLFHAAIAMSGSFLSPWSFINDPIKARQRICDKYKVSDCTLDGIVENFGGNLTMFVHFYSAPKTTSSLVWGCLWPMFRPGPEYPGDTPWTRLINGTFNDVPLLMGVCKDDLNAHYLGRYLEQYPQTTMDFPFHDPLKVQEVLEMLEEIQYSLKIFDYMNYAHMFHGVYRFLDEFSKRSKKSQYFYSLNYNPSDGSNNTVVHGHDLELLFRNYDKSIPGSEDVAKFMAKVWTNFIKNG